MQGENGYFYFRFHLYPEHMNGASVRGLSHNHDIQNKTKYRLDYQVYSMY